ncbi:hypothetical protein [uncultured Clostridium sp.]|uniref:hypothetical protein n=1 Tax=uncultured Clostridium sp. TaxID=59620 RepID=UPI0026159AA7|nr:hypothetical protein [uncultured Clostridium sp.]
MIDIAQNNRISVVRGDSFSVPLFLNQGTDVKPIRYRLQESDEVYLAIMEPNQPFEDALVKKVFTNKDLNNHGDIKLEINHDDTRCLEPGKYFYQIKARLYDREKEKFDINTVIPKTEF